MTDATRASDKVEAAPPAASSCLNCGAALTGPYCQACGQKAEVRRSLRAFMGDFAAGLLNFEGKFWRTLPMLAWHPGDLTRRYIAGERVRFISPIALYLFTVFLMFAVLSFNGTLDTGGNVADIQTNFDQAIAKQEAQNAATQKLRDEAAKAGKDTKALDVKLAEGKSDLASLHKISGKTTLVKSDFDEGTPEWVKTMTENLQKDPEAAITNVQDAASKYSWLVIILSLPFMWMLFPFSRRYKMYDHTVFVTYSLSFMMMLVIASGLLVAVGMGSFAGLLFFIPPFHLYRQLREAYGLPRWSALLRTSILIGFCFAVAAMFAAAMVAIGVF